jgi:hypothetical protein
MICRESKEVKKEMNCTLKKHKRAGQKADMRKETGEKVENMPRSGRGYSRES